ncbi:MAG: sulfatase [Puniceicoccaceae bacterium]
MKNKRHPFAKLLFACCILTVASVLNAGTERPNILLIVADDLNYDSLGFVNGGVAPDVTPNIDRLHGESISFDKAFTTVSVCQPSRQSMLSGLLPHNYGSGGFFPMEEGTPTIVNWLREAGYITGNIHKLHHMLPESSFKWHYDNKRLGLKAPDGVVGRHPEMIAGAFRKLIHAADKKEKPFFMVVNSADPHRPFHGDPMRAGDFFWGFNQKAIQPMDPSRVYNPEEVVVPPTLPDLPGIRTDLAKYASSIRRLDDTVGACLSVLDDLDKEKTTLVIFVADNGMPLPFAKFDVYLGSNQTPLLMRWPELIKQPVVDEHHLVSLMDLTPTILELVGLNVPDGLDGQSLGAILQGSEPENWRDSIVWLRNSDIYYGDAIRRSLKSRPDFKKELEARNWVERPDHPSPDTFYREKEMRTWFDGRYGYIYNHCFDPDGLENNPLGLIVPYSDSTARAMSLNSEKDTDVKARYQHYLLRAKEELYDWSKDPGSQQNLALDPEYAEVLARARKGLLQWMQQTADPLSSAFQQDIR